jgi:membrane fusion protein (multidrug efflux system)
MVRLLIFLGIVGGMGAAAWLWWEDRQRVVAVYDARLAADMVTLSAAQAGYLTHLYVNTGDTVAPGQPLARMDTRALDLEIAEIGNEIAELDAARLKVDSELVLVRARNVAMASMAQARIEAARAELRSIRVRRDRVATDLQRAEKLFVSRVISSQSVESARTEAERAGEQARQLEAEVRQSEVSLEAARAEQANLAVLKAEQAVLLARASTRVTRRERLRTDRTDRDFSYQHQAVISRTFAHAGEYLRTGTRLLMLHRPDAIWVDANVKETELYRFAEGARVEVRIDALPDEVFAGTVAWIGPAATSEFALLPNPNPSGNFTKVTQRVPIRIKLEVLPPSARPGTMVEVRIDAAQR